MKPYHVDRRQFEAIIHHAESLAESGCAREGKNGAACRISRAVIRALYEALHAELERGTDPQDIMQGYQPALSNVFGALINLCESNENAVPIMADWSGGLIAETVARLALIDNPELAPENIAYADQAKGQRT